MIPVGDTPSVRADIEAHATCSGFPAALHCLEIPVAGCRIEPGFPRFVLCEQLSRECVDWAGIDAGCATPAPGRHGSPGRGEGGVGQDRDPPDPGPVVGSDEETAAPDPAEARHVRCQFVGEDPCNLLVARPF